MYKDYNDARSLLKKMRDGKYVKEDVTINDEKPKELTMRDLLAKTRKLNEQEEAAITKNRKTVYDQQREEQNFRNFFQDLNVDIDFIELEVHDDLIFWGGTVDGMVQFVYKVAPDEATSGIEFNYLEGFSLDNPDNDEIVKKIETYYDTFYKYWRNNVLNT